MKKDDISDSTDTIEACEEYPYVYVDDSYHDLLDVEKSGLMPREIIDLLKEKKWSRLTNLQIISYEYITKGFNTLITAPTGSGKTEAALLPLLSKIRSEGADNEKGVILLYITPMRALINDLYKRISWWASRLSLVVSRKHGDVSQSERIKRLKRIPHILIITPESLEIDLDWSIRFREYYKTIKYIVIDEVHELVGSKRGVQLAVLIERLKRLSGEDPQIILLSASIGDPCYILRFFTYSSSRQGVIIASRGSKKIRLDIEFLGERHDQRNIAEKIKSLYEPTTIVFVNSRYMAEKIHEALEQIGLRKVYVHHSSISSRIKEEVENKIKLGEAEIVVSTRTLELGVDLGYVNKIILHRSPGQVVSLIQRIGRSGHSLDGVSRGVIITDNRLDLVEIAALIKLLEENYIEKPRIYNKPLDVVARVIEGASLRGTGDLENIYSIIRSVYVFKDLSYEEFMRVIDELVESGVLERYDYNSVRVSKRFFRIWGFNNKNSIKSFSEFFTYINDSDIYQVKRGDEVIGSLDDFFVYRFLRAGDVIRLSGRLWKILRIDDSNKVIEVSLTDDPEGLVPIWSGDVSEKTRVLAMRFYEILRRGLSIDKSHNHIECRGLEEINSVINEIREWFRSNNTPIPSENILVIERHEDEKIMLYPFGEKLAELVGYVLLNEAISRSGDSVGVRISSYGVSLVGSDLDPVELLVNIARENRVEEAVKTAIRRSPRLRAKVREIQFSFGRVSNAESNEFIVEEAVKQLLDELRDDYSIEDFIRDLYEKKIRVYKVSPRRPSPIAERILLTPPTRIWLRDLSYTIYKALKNMAMNTLEIAEVTGLPPELVESRLKEMRKDPRLTVTQFRDVSLNEIKWVLLEDLEEISRDPLFRESFEPIDLDELYEISLKIESKASPVKIMIRARELYNGDIESLNKLINSDEIYEIKITNVEDSFSRGASVSYYNVRREALKYLILNGIAYLQRVKE